MSNGKQLAGALQRCATLSQKHQEAMDELCKLMDERYGDNAYSRIEKGHIAADTDLVEPVNYGGSVPSVATLDAMFRDLKGGDT